MQNAESEKDFREQTGKRIAQPIVEVHRVAKTNGVVVVGGELAFWSVETSIRESLNC